MKMIGRAVRAAYFQTAVTYGRVGLIRLLLVLASGLARAWLRRRTGSSEVTGARQPVQISGITSLQYGGQN